MSFIVSHKIPNNSLYETPMDSVPVNGSERPTQGLEASGKVGVTRFVLRNKESLAILKPYKNVIVLNRIRFEQEIRSTSELKLPPLSKKATKEMDMAEKLIDQLTEKFDITGFKDEYTTKLLDIIKKKAKGKVQKPTKLKVVHNKQSDDLMSMLKASLETKTKKSS